MARPISLWHTLRSFSYWYKAKITLQDHQYFEMCLSVSTVQALSCLCTLGPLCLEEYMVCQGSTRLLLILEWCHSSHSEQYITCRKNCRV